MSKLLKVLAAKRRQTRVRARVVGTPERPRLSVYVSARQITAQLIDDSKGVTLAASDSKTAKEAKTMTEKATWVGTDVAKKALKGKHSRVVFDRGGRKFHGLIKNLADKAREAGLEF